MAVVCEVVCYTEARPGLSGKTRNSSGDEIANVTFTTTSYM